MVACHVRAETDDEYVLNRIHTVRVTLSSEALAAAVGRAQAAGTVKVRRSKPLVVECLPILRTAPVDEDDMTARIPVPAPGAPTDLHFDLVASEVGDAEVAIHVRQGTMTLLALTLAMPVVAARTGAKRALRVEADIAEFPAAPRATDELRIIEMRPTGATTRYRFELRLPSVRVQQEFYSDLLDTDPASYISQIHDRIQDRWTEHRSERDAFARDLRAIGADLFDTLFPLELRQLLWTHRNAIASVQVLSSEPFIPWELVHLRDPSSRKLTGDGTAFLGELGVVRWLVSGYPPEQLQLRKGKARFVVPRYPKADALPAAQEEIALVKERFGASEVPAEAEAVYRLLESPGNFDLLHIACHGLADPADIGSARLEMPGKRRSDGSMSEEHIMAATVRREADLRDGEAQPIVVLNACQSARSGYTLKGMGGFAQAFVEGGAGVFIGSSWSVGDEPALAFIDEFYARFLGNGRRPVTLATAVAEARKKARADGDATWLAYVVYGHPRAVARVR
jgi:hypothetical protein